MVFFKKSISHYKSILLIVLSLSLFGFNYSSQAIKKKLISHFQSVENKARYNESTNQPALDEITQNTPILVISEVNTSSDDAEEDTSDGNVELNSGDLELIYDNVDQVVGIRFDNLNIPQCAVINNAFIRFTAKNASVDPCTLTFFGEDSDDALTFSNDDFDISGREKTTAFTTWEDIDDWQNDGETQQTPNLTAIIQEIVNRAGFSDSSAISIIIEGSGVRRAYSFDDLIADGAPALYIVYDPDIIPDSDGDGTCDANDVCPGEPEPGTPCNDLDSGTYNDMIDSTCMCVGIQYECYPNPYDIGDTCDDGNPNTINDMIDSMCVCVGTYYDCPTIPANFGDSCDDGDPNTYNDVYNSACVCEGTPYECLPDLFNPGDPCDDNDPTTSSDMIDSMCICVGLPFICVKVENNSDDAEEEITGNVSLGSNDLEMVYDDTTQIVGLRFNNINIPQCAVITNAYVQFTAKGSNNTNPCTFEIYGEDSDNASNFVNVDSNISIRPRTDAMVGWSPIDWDAEEADSAQQTPNIAPIIQEIVDREGFISGNSIAIVIEGIGIRRAYAYDGDPLKAPEICIEYDPVPPDSDGDGTCDANDLCDGGPEPGTPCDDLNPNTINDMIDSTCTCIGTYYDCPLIPANFGDPCDDGEANTYNDIIDSMCMCVGTPTICFPDPYNPGDPCDDNDPTTTNDAVNSDCVCEGIPFVEVSVALSSDDAEEDDVTGDMSLTSDDLEMEFDNPSHQIVGIRFDNLNIPQCSEIHRAYIQFTAKNPNDIDPCILEIYGEDSDNANTFVNIDSNISTRPRTDAVVIWEPEAWLNAGDSGPAQQTPDLSPIIQEIVNLASFTDTSAMAFIIEGTGLRRAHSFDQPDPSLAAVLHVEYFDSFPDSDADGVCDINDLCPGGPEPGTPCDDLDIGTYNDMIDSNCDCVGIQYECYPDPYNYGDLCDDNNPNTINDMIDSMCVCVGIPYDCPSIPANIGDSCDDGDPTTYNDVYNDDCECEGTLYDCLPNLSNIGDSCDDGDPSTSSDMLDSMCICVGLPFICIRVDNNLDDAEEDITGDVNLGSNDLEMVYDDTTQIVGLRFNNINIPQCAVITNAYIQFTAKGSNNTNPCILEIYGEDSDNAGTFVNVDSSISFRQRTDAMVGWSPVDWDAEESDSAQQTPNITPIIQEIVNREGFISGNSIAIVIQGTGIRRAYAYEGDPLKAPEICIEYDPIPPDSDGDGTCDANDLCPDGPEPGSPCDDGDPDTPNDFVDANCNCVGGFDCPSLMLNFGDPCDDTIPGTYNDTIVDPTCVCMGTWECPDYPGGPVGYGYPCDDLDPTTTNDAIDSTCVCVGIPFVSMGITLSSDDAEEDNVTGEISLTSNDLEMELDGTSHQIVGIRFNNLNIPQCSEINRAYIQFTAKGSTNIDPCILEIYGEDSDNASTFENVDSNIFIRPKTDAMVIWSPDEWQSNEDSVSQQTPDLSPVIQEIANRLGFSDTSSIAFIIEGTGLRRAFSFDNTDSTLAPVLYIEYFDSFPDADDDGVCDANDLCNGPDPGLPCDDGNPQTYNDLVDSMCVCSGTFYDCLDLLANVGDFCDDGDPVTQNDFINEDCECVGGFECPDLMLNIGDPCDDENPGTYDDVVDENCDCMGTWDCPGLMAGIGDPCDDQDPNTIDDTVNSNCECVGSLAVFSSVSESSDDAEEKESGSVNLTSSDLELIENGNGQVTVGVRFTNLNIPRRAIIDTAYIQFTTHTEINEDPCEIFIYGEYSDDAQTFQDVNSDISSRFKTNSIVTWTPEQWLIDDEAGPLQRTPNINTIVKEIVDRNGFSENSSIAVIMIGTGTRSAVSYDGNPEKAPKLYIRYELPPIDTMTNQGDIPFVVYPNPTANNLHVAFTSKSDNESLIKIYDLNGRVIYEKLQQIREGNNDILIENLQFSNGVYFLQINVDDTLHTAKFILMK